MRALAVDFGRSRCDGPRFCNPYSCPFPPSHRVELVANRSQNVAILRGPLKASFALANHEGRLRSTWYHPASVSPPDTSRRPELPVGMKTAEANSRGTCGRPGLECRFPW